MDLTHNWNGKWSEWGRTVQMNFVFAFLGILFSAVIWLHDEWIGMMKYVYVTLSLQITYIWTWVPFSLGEFLRMRQDSTKCNMITRTHTWVFFFKCSRHWVKKNTRTHYEMTESSFLFRSFPLIASSVLVTTNRKQSSATSSPATTNKIRTRKKWRKRKTHEDNGLVAKAKVTVRTLIFCIVFVVCTPYRRHMCAERSRESVEKTGCPSSLCIDGKMQCNANYSRNISRHFSLCIVGTFIFDRKWPDIGRWERCAYNFIGCH